MRIGVTERGDAGIDFSWYDKLDTVDGAVIISKKLSNTLIDKLLTASRPVVYHCGCTGWGGTWLEPNVPDYTTQLNLLKTLIDRGFSATNIVLRIDPIIPTDEGIERACAVIEYVMNHNIPISRIRVSVYDEYKHVRERLAALGESSFYGGSFYAPSSMMQKVITALSRYPYTFETCAEDFIASRSDKFMSAGCISGTELSLMNLTLPDNLSENIQNRNGCHCLSCKTELLTQRHKCPNGCIYCYWR